MKINVSAKLFSPFILIGPGGNRPIFSTRKEIVLSPATLATVAVTSEIRFDGHVFELEEYEDDTKTFVVRGTLEGVSRGFMKNLSMKGWTLLKENAAYHGLPSSRKIEKNENEEKRRQVQSLVGKPTFSAPTKEQRKLLELFRKREKKSAKRAK